MGFDFDDIQRELGEALTTFAENHGTTGLTTAALGAGDGTTAITNPQSPYSRSVKFYRDLPGGRDGGSAILPDWIPFENNPNVANMPVLLGKVAGDKKLRVLGVGGLAGNYAQGPTSLIEGKINDAAYPTLDRVAAFRVQPTNPTSQNVTIPGAYLYFKPSTGARQGFIAGASPTIAPTIASALATLSGTGKHQLAVVCLDPEAGTLKLVTNSAVTPASTLGTQDAHDEFGLSDILALATSLYIASAPFELWDGQATVEESAFYRDYDLRVMFPPIQAYVAGAASSTDSDFAMFSGSNGKLLKDSGLSLTTDGTLAANSDSLIPTEKAVKFYIDAVATGLSPKASVKVSSAAALAANTYANGSSGVGATLTGNSTGVLTVDGVAVALNDRVLVKDEATGSHNGIYLCTTAGAVGVAYVLTRTTDNDTSGEIIGSFVFVEAGTANASRGFVCTNSASITVGTTAVAFTQISGGSGVTGITAGAGLSGGTITTSGTVAVDIDGQTNKAAPTSSDEVMIWDAAASAIKKATLNNLPTGATGIPSTGWVDAAETWTYASADSPTFTFTVAADVTAKYSAGMRVRLVQTTTKYFIITAVSTYSGGVTTITIYGGVNYTLANAAISANYYSAVKAPFGFSLNPTDWTVEVSDTSDRDQSSPTSGTWYNLGTISISVPIGCWKVSYKALLSGTKLSSTVASAAATLSTANNSESDVDLTTRAQFNGAAAGAGQGNRSWNQVYTEKYLTLSSKTSYFLNVKTADTGQSDLEIRGDLVKTIIRAACAYL